MQNITYDSPVFNNRSQHFNRVFNMVNSNNAEIIKERIRMTDVISFYGFHPNRSGYICCPFHQEKTPSLKIYPGGQGWYCYGCGAGGSVIDFVMKLFHVNFSAAIAKLDSDFNLGLQTGPLTLRDKQRLTEKQAEIKQKRNCEEIARRQYEIMYRMMAAKYRHLSHIQPPKNPEAPPSKEWIEALQQLDYLDWWLNEYNHFERWQQDYGEQFAKAE